MGRDWYALSLLALLAVGGCSGDAGADAAQAAPAARAATASPSRAAGATAAQTPATRAATAAADSAAVEVDSARRAREIEVTRETFAYQGGTRDPFNSLITGATVGPELADLQLVGIYEDVRVPSNSVVVLREKVGAKRHKMRVGDQLGRLRLAQIRSREVVFMIQDLGFERQETLSLRKQEDATP